MEAGVALAVGLLAICVGLLFALCGGVFLGFSVVLAAWAMLALGVCALVA